MKRQLRLFFTALAFFTRIPCLRWAGRDEADLNHAARYFPLVGLVVGLLAAIVCWLAAQVFPQSVAVLLSMVASLWLTGAFHEDGLADSVDGLGGGWDKQQVLTIMKDSRIGSYGAIALVMALLLKFEVLSSLPAMLLPVVLVAGHALSRLGAVVVIFQQEYVRENGKAKPLASQISMAELSVAIATGMAPLLILPRNLWWSVLPVVLVWLWFSRVLKRRLGGYTGDCLGAMQQLCELAFYLGVLAWNSI